MMTRTPVQLVLHCAIATGIALAATGCWSETAPASTPAGGPPPGIAMTQTFAEEFDGSAIDTRRWNLAYGARRPGKGMGDRTLWGNRELQLYFDRAFLDLGIDPFTVADGVLTITARPLDNRAKIAVASEGARSPEQLKQGLRPEILAYSSGAITTRDTFKQKYGYFEIRASWSTGKGIWPAFWLLPATGEWPPEIDVIEAHGDKPGVAYHSIHSKVAPKVTLVAKVGGSQQEYRTYGVLWLPDRLDYYIDGKLTGTVKAPGDFHQPMYLLANLAIGGYWPGNPTPDTQFPATYKIDHIRAWQFDKPPPVPAR